MKIKNFKVKLEGQMKIEVLNQKSLKSLLSVTKHNTHNLDYLNQHHKSSLLKILNLRRTNLLKKGKNFLKEVRHAEKVDYQQLLHKYYKIKKVIKV